METIRTLTLTDESKIVEDITNIDHVKMSLSYSIIDAPFPFYNYSSNMIVTQRTDKTELEWTANFDTHDGQEEDEVVSTLENFYLKGFDGIRKLIEDL